MKSDGGHGGCSTQFTFAQHLVSDGVHTSGMTGTTASSSCFPRLVRHKRLRDITWA
jgi:hypothetical protein